MIPSADKLDADFLTQQYQKSTHTTKATTKWFADLQITVLD